MGGGDTDTGAALAPTVESCDPEDLRDVDSDDVQAAGSSLGHES